MLNQSKTTINAVLNGKQTTVVVKSREYVNPHGGIDTSTKYDFHFGGQFASIVVIETRCHEHCCHPVNGGEALYDALKKSPSFQLIA